MAIVKSCKMAVYILAEKINPVIEYIQGAAIMEMESGVRSLPQSAVGGVERELLRVDAAIAKLKPFSDRKGLFGRRGMLHSTDKRHTDAARAMVEDVLNTSGQIEKNQRQIEVLAEDVQKYERFYCYCGTELTEETEYTKGGLFYGESGSLQRLIAEASRIPFFCKPAGNEKDDKLIFCVYLKSDEKYAESIIKKHGFSVPDIFLCGLPPKEEARLRKDKQKALLAENEELRRKLKKQARGLSQIELLYDMLMLKRERYQAFLSAKNTEKVFILTGYVLKPRLEEFKKRIAELGGFAEEISPNKDEIMPVAFVNNAFSAPVEDVTANYAMPSETDIDPNPIMSVFYYWFFGMMFSDAGYGLLMMLFCGILGFSKILKKGNRSMYRMFFWCGVSTTLWGIAYGSFFGDLIGTISKVFGNGNMLFLPVLIDPVNQALELLIISVVFGLVHILTALSIRFFILWRDGKRTDAVCDAGTWIAVLLGVGIFVSGSAMGADAVKVLGLLLSLAGVLVLLVMSGRDKKSLLSRVFSGILSLYDITGFVGDLLSYSRLMALGLATGVIASVVNVLASLGGNSGLGTVLFVAVAVFGHSLNFAINMLGAYVHTNRLQYVEFYQKFYSGGGKRFRPVSGETKYFDSDNGRNGIERTDEL